MKDLQHFLWADLDEYPRRIEELGIKERETGWSLQIIRETVYAELAEVSPLELFARQNADPRYKEAYLIYYQVYARLQRAKREFDLRMAILKGGR